MPLAFVQHAEALRFGTEKSVGFTRLIGIFDSAAMRDSFPRTGQRWGALPHILFELMPC